jgi:hypothetical protein
MPEEKLLGTTDSDTRCTLFGHLRASTCDSFAQNDLLNQSLLSDGKTFAYTMNLNYYKVLTLKRYLYDNETLFRNP